MKALLLYNEGGGGGRRRQMDTFGGDASSGEEEGEDRRERRVRDPSSIDPSYRISPPGTPKEESKLEEQARNRRHEEYRIPSSSSSRRHQHVPVRYAAPSISPRGKFLRILPVVFVLLLVACLGCIYTLFHIIPLIQGGGGSSSPDGRPLSPQTRDARFARGLGEGIVFFILLVLQLVCFFLAVVTPPGFVPPEFSSEAEEGSMLLQQTVRFISLTNRQFPP